MIISVVIFWVVLAVKSNNILHLPLWLMDAGLPCLCSCFLPVISFLPLVWPLRCTEYTKRCGQWYLSIHFLNPALFCTTGSQEDGEYPSSQWWQGTPHTGHSLLKSKHRETDHKSHWQFRVLSLPDIHAFDTRENQAKTGKACNIHTDRPQSILNQEPLGCETATALAKYHPTKV